MNSYLRFIIVNNSIFSFAGSLIVPMYALLVLDFGGNVELAGVLFGVQYITVTLVELVIIRMKDKVSIGEKMLKLNYLLRGLAWFSLIFFPTIPNLFLVQIVTGFTTAIGSPAFNSLISEHLDKQKHIRDWGYAMLIDTTAIALASILSGYLVTWYGYQILFAIMASCAFLAFVLLQFRRKVQQTVPQI